MLYVHVIVWGQPEYLPSRDLSYPRSSRVFLRENVSPHTADLSMSFSGERRGESNWPAEAPRNIQMRWDANWVNEAGPQANGFPHPLLKLLKSNRLPLYSFQNDRFFVSQTSQVDSARVLLKHFLQRKKSKTNKQKRQSR